MDKNLLYRSIPKVDCLLEKEEIKLLMETYGHDRVMEVLREKLGELRRFIGVCQEDGDVFEKISRLPKDICKAVKKSAQPDIRAVINGTGTILHTNLGRAPLSLEHAEKLKEITAGYCNLEYDLNGGERGERYSHFEELLCRLTGAEAAMAVNNNAAAVLLILNSLAAGGEVIVSRGELVEIGGAFRIPDVMRQGGAVLIETGTTNKTRLTDYEAAVTEETKALLKVHTSNYRIVGFTEAVPAKDLVPLAQEYKIPLVEDLGSGVLIDLKKYGLPAEPSVQDAINSGVDVVCFSGDKLLGGPQAGIIAGKKKYVDQMKKNPLTRALRIDKFTAAALELVLKEYLSQEKAVQNIPVLKMLHESAESVEERAETLKRMLVSKNIKAEVTVIPCGSQVGGGAMPLAEIPSAAVLIRPLYTKAEELERCMRGLTVPIISRIADDAVYLDMRTVEPRWLEQIAKSLGDLIV